MYYRCTKIFNLCKLIFGVPIHLPPIEVEVFSSQNNKKVKELSCLAGQYIYKCRNAVKGTRKMITRVVKIIAVDYDGTLGVADATPNKKNIYSDAVDVLCEFQRRGGEVVLWTCRHGRPLLEVVEACHDAGLDFDAVNENAPRHMRRWLARHPEDIGMKQSPKVYADIYLDDHARFDGQVDWGRLRKELLEGE